MDSQPQRDSRPLQSALDRRTFVKRATIGAAAAGAVALVPALAKEGIAPETVAAIEESQASGPVMVYVRDAAKGEVLIMADETESVVVDPVLVSHLLQAQRRKPA